MVTAVISANELAIDTLKKKQAGSPVFAVVDFKNSTSAVSEAQVKLHSTRQEDSPWP